MRIRLARAASVDLDEAYEYIAKDSPGAAGALIERLLAAIESLTEAPLKGRIGRLSGTRELVVSHSNYIVIYQIASDEIRVMRVIHGRRRWPPE